MARKAGLFLACLFLFPSLAIAASRVDNVLPLNLKSFGSSITEEAKFDKMVKAAIHNRKNDPLLYQAYQAKKELTRNPNDRVSNEILCNAYFQTGFMAAAAKQCRDVLKIDPKSAMARTTIADLAFRQGKPKEAEQLLQEVLRDQPNYSKANIVLAQIMKERGDDLGAHQQVSEALKSNPDAAALVAMGDLQTKSGQTDQAINSYLKALQSDPNNTLALNSLANLYGGKGDYQRALDFAQKAAQTDPKSALAQYTLGTQYENIGRMEEAIVQYAKSVQLDPNFALGHRALGMALQKKGSPVDAITSLNRALQLSPNDPTATAARSKAYASLGYPEAQSAQPQSQSSPLPPSAMPAQNAKIINLRAKAAAAEQAKNYELARQYYEQMLIEQPENPEHFYNIGRIYTIAQQWPSAERFYALALERNPNHTQSLVEIAKIKCYSGDAQTAWENYSKAVKSGFIDNARETGNYLQKACPAPAAAH